MAKPYTWDLFVRVTHWLVAALFLASFYAIMISAMWFLLLATGLSGWMSEWDLFWGEDWIKEVHETLANLTMAAVAVHVSAVIIMSKFTGHPYVHGMLIGHKTSSQNSEQS